MYAKLEARTFLAMLVGVSLAFVLLMKPFRAHLLGDRYCGDFSSVPNVSGAQAWRPAKRERADYLNRVHVDCGDSGAGAGDLPGG